MPKKILKKFKKYAKYVLGALGVAVLVLFAVYLTSGQSVLPEADGFKESFGSTSGALPAPQAAETQARRLVSESAPGRDSSVEAGDSEQAGQPAERKVVKRGELEILVKKAEETAEKMKALAGELGGFTDEVYLANVSETSKSGTVTIRVPADKFNEAMAKVKALAIKVDSEEVAATDITAEFTDLEAWLKNLRAEEQQYVKVMAQAGKVEDILNVSQNLSAVRGDIERLSARINYLSSQIDLSSITASLTEEADVQIFGLRWRPLFVVKQSFRNMLTGLSGYIDSMIAFIFFLPALILWLATFVAGLWAARKIYRFIRTKFFSSRA